MSCRVVRPESCAAPGIENIRVLVAPEGILPKHSGGKAERLFRDNGKIGRIETVEQGLLVAGDEELGAVCIETRPI